jgi:hypothetical protein
MNLDLLLCSLPKLNLVCPHSGIALLNAVAKRAGFQSRVLDLNVELAARFNEYFPGESWESIEPIFADPRRYRLASPKLKPWIELWTDRILEKNPRFVGFSLFTQRNRFIALDFCRALRLKNSEVKIVIGGADCARSKSAFQAEGLVDFHIVGEAEEAILHILNGFHSRPGVNSRALPIRDLSVNPVPDYSDIDFSKYLASPPALFITASRGCPFCCSFCDVRSIWQTYRLRAPARVAEEMESGCREYGARTFFFTDSLLNGNMTHFRELFRLCTAVNERWNILWEGFCVVSPEGTMTDGDFHLLKASGCDRIKIGVESGSPQVRKHMRKPYRSRDLDAFMAQASRTGIGVDFMLMVGYPTEGESDFEMTKALLRNHRHYALDGTIKFIRLDMTHLGEGQPLYATRARHGISIDPKTGQWSSPGNTFEIRKRRYLELRDYALGLGYRILATQDAERAAIYKE